MTLKINLDSSIIISHLSGDVHQDDVLTVVEQLELLQAELFFSLVCYAEVWTGIELLPQVDQDEAARECN